MDRLFAGGFFFKAVPTGTTFAFSVSSSVWDFVVREPMVATQGVSPSTLLWVDCRDSDSATTSLAVSRDHAARVHARFWPSAIQRRRRESLLHAPSALALWGSLPRCFAPRGNCFQGSRLFFLLRRAAVVRDRAHARSQWMLMTAHLIVLTVENGCRLGKRRHVGTGALEQLASACCRFRIQSNRDVFALPPILSLTSPRVGGRTARVDLGFYAVADSSCGCLTLGPAPTLMGNPLMYRGRMSVLMYLTAAITPSARDVSGWP